MAKLTRQQVEFLRLLNRSPDIGEGWRTVSGVSWRLVEEFDASELIEIDAVFSRVRLTAKGETVFEYLA